MERQLFFEQVSHAGGYARCGALTPDASQSSKSLKFDLFV